MNNNNSAQRSDQCETMSRSSSIPSLSSLCSLSSLSSSSSMSCLGDVCWQYEPLKVDVDEVENNQQTSNQIIPDTTSGKEDQSNSSSIVPMFPSEVTVDDDNHNNNNIKTTELVFELSSRTTNNNININNNENNKLKKPCLKQNLKFRKPTKFSLKRKRSDRSTTTTTTRMSDKRLRVKLKPEVCIIPIPLRTEYSCHIKNSLWSSSSELYANALRNSIEFAAEGFDWRKVTEDDQMVVHVDSGELIHPVHIQNVFDDPELGSDLGSDTSDSTNSQDNKN